MINRELKDKCTLSFFKRVVASLSFLLFSSFAHADFYTPENVIFPLDGVLIQRIPERNKNLFKPEEILTVSYQNRNYIYVFHAEAQRVIARLKKDGHNIIIYTWESQSLADTIARNFKIPELENKSLGEIAVVLGGEKRDRNETFVESAFAKPVEKSIFVFSVSMRLSQNLFESGSYQTGPIYYSYPSFAKASEGRGGDTAIISQKVKMTGSKKEIRSSSFMRILNSRLQNQQLARNSSQT